MAEGLQPSEDSEPVPPPGDSEPLPPPGDTEPRMRRWLARLRRTLPGRILAAVGDRVGANLRDPAMVLPLVFIGALATRAIWLELPHALVFDEAYYVNAARVILGWAVPAGGHYAGSPMGLDPNSEHPPLGKVLIAGSMLIFGDNGLGWRLPSLIAGMVALGATYRIVRATGEGPWFGILVVSMLALDNLTFVHGRIGTLDMLVLAPILVAAWLALRERWALAGLATAIGLLMKITAIYGIGAVLLLVLLRKGPDWWRQRRIPLADVRGPIVFVAVFVVAGLAGLGLLDARFTAFASPFDHLRRMIDYGSALRAPVSSVGFCPSTDSRPWEWIFNECQIPYYRTDVTVRAGGKVIAVITKLDVRGALNPFLVGAIPLSTLFAVWYAVKARSLVAMWALAWGAANYLPYVLLGLATHRIMYIYYTLPLVPALAVAVALLLRRSGLPRFVQAGFLVAYVMGFIAYFPFRTIP